MDITITVSDKEQHAAESLARIIDPKGKIVLQEFGSTAVLMRPGNPYEPFVVASGYDRSTGEWASGYYTSDLAYAMDMANPDVLERATIRWMREDFSMHLEEEGIEPTDENIDALIEECNGMRGWQETSISDGNEFIDMNIDFADLERPEAQMEAVDKALKEALEYADGLKPTALADKAEELAGTSLHGSSTLPETVERSNKAER